MASRNQHNWNRSEGYREKTASMFGGHKCNLCGNVSWYYVPKRGHFCGEHKAEAYQAAKETTRNGGFVWA